MNVEKGGLRGGFRVFMVHVDRGNMERLRQLFRTSLMAVPGLRERCATGRSG